MTFTFCDSKSQHNYLYYHNWVSVLLRSGHCFVLLTHRFKLRIQQELLFLGIAIHPPPPKKKLNSFSSFSLRMHSRIKCLKEYRSLGLGENFVFPKVCRTLIKQHLYLSFTEGPALIVTFFRPKVYFVLASIEL